MDFAVASGIFLFLALAGSSYYGIGKCMNEKTASIENNT